MAMYFHFLRRDLRDSAPSWIAALVVVSSAVMANHLYAFDGALASSVLYFGGLGVCLMGISQPHSRGIWGGKNPAPVPRTYLKELPLRRRTTFWLCFARGVPGDIPVALYLMWVLPHFNVPATLASRVKGYPILPRSAHPSEYLLCLGVVLVYIFYSQLASATWGLFQDRLNHTSARFLRIRGFAAMTLFGGFLPNFLAVGVDWILFCTFYEIPLNGFGWWVAVLALPVSAAQLYWLYRTWLWT